MMRARKKNESNRSIGLVQGILLAAATLSVILTIYGGDGSATGHSTMGILSDDESYFNAKHAEDQRFQHSQQCTKATAESFFTAPSDVPNGVAVPSTVPKCDFTFLDLGANVGDSLGKFIDVGLPDCSSFHFFTNYEVRSARLRTDNNDQEHTNRLTRWTRDMLHTASRQLGQTLYPEHYCYVGVEGNPSFTARLRQQQAAILQSVPRPVRHAHFYTETVATAQHGASIPLYLDTTNVAQNYWGSSIYASHPDVVANNNNTTAAAIVAGRSLTHLVTETTRQSYGNHLLIKMDIEGAEYVVMNEAHAVLCQYAEAAVRVDIMIETHPKVCMFV